MTTFGGGKYGSTDISGSVQRTTILYNDRMDDMFTFKNMRTPFHIGTPAACTLTVCRPLVVLFGCRAYNVPKAGDFYQGYP